MIQSDVMTNVKPSVSPQYYLKEFDDVLMGRRKTYSSALMAKEQGPFMCAELLKSIFKLYLKWTPEDVRDNLTPEIVQQLKISPLVKRIPCPPEVDSTTELYYVAWYLYPETRNVQEPELIIKLYTDILNGKVKKFPSGYFDGNDGYLRAHILFLTMVREYLHPFKNLEALYKFFASPEGKNCLMRYKLTIPLRELYGSALAFLHDALPWSQKDEDLYRKYNRLQSLRENGNYLPVTKQEREELMMMDTRSEDDCFVTSEYEQLESDDAGNQEDCASFEVVQLGDEDDFLFAESFSLSGDDSEKEA